MSEVDILVEEVQQFFLEQKLNELWIILEENKC